MFAHGTDLLEGPKQRKVKVYIRIVFRRGRLILLPRELSELLFVGQNPGTFVAGIWRCSRTNAVRGSTGQRVERMRGSELLLQEEASVL